MVGEEEEEEEPENANIYAHRIRIVIEVDKVPRFDLYVPKSMEKEFEEFMEACKRDSLSASRVIVRLIRTWLAAHKEGNAQLTLDRGVVTPPYEYDLFPVERRRQLIEDLMETIKANPDAPREAIIAAFSVASGLREETLRTYIATLKRAGKL